MAKKVFFSFHYVPDSWRASQVRNIGSVEGNQLLTDNDWEEVVEEGDEAVQAWIDSQLSGKSCAIVLIGTGTYGRKWVDYEIKKAWNSGKGVVGIYVHNLKNRYGEQASKGSNPFGHISVDGEGLDDIVKSYDPPYSTSTNVYNYIKDHIEGWVDEAVEIRSNY